MRIATWNINSVRLRAQTVAKFLKSHNPDVLCLQETKTPDAHFPSKEFHKLGYNHIHMAGMKGYNGVAILSKSPFIAQDTHNRAGREDCRHIEAQINVKGVSKPVTIHCLYIPAGGDIPDIDENEKFKHKLDFIDELTEWFPKRHANDDPVIAVGDFNIAPQENDVWSHKQLLKVVSHTPIEVEKLNKMQKSLNWTDGAREFVAPEEKLYSWWSYRARNWLTSNRGRRLDHIWATQPIAKNMVSHEVFSEARGWEKPSDHVPVIIDFKF